MNTDQEQQRLETQLFNKVLLNRIEQKRDQVKRLKAENYAMKLEKKELKKQLENVSGPKLIKEIFSFVGMISIAIFTIFALYKAFL